MRSPELYHSKTRASGFTFVEILTAMLFMAIVIPVTVHGVLLINRVGEVASRKRIAMELADRILSQAIVTEAWRNSDLQGDFAEDAPGYRYEVHADDWGRDEMHLITAHVYYSVQGREYSETASTLALQDELDDTPGSSGTATGTQTGTGTGANSGSRGGGTQGNQRSEQGPTGSVSGRTGAR